MDLSEIIEARKKWNNIFLTLKENNCQSEILSVAQISFRHKGEINTFSLESALRKFIGSRRAFKKRF